MAKKNTIKIPADAVQTDCHGRKAYIVPGTNTVVHELPSGNKEFKCKNAKEAEAQLKECLSISAIQY